MVLKSIDLNCDMGELMPGRTTNFDLDIMPYISSCNVACGFHSGTPTIIETTIRAALAAGVAVGAHPSYNDPTNFGRKSISEELDVLLAEWRYQISAIKGMVESLGGQLQHVKPHGALYNDMVKEASLATAFIQLVKEINSTLNIMGLAHSQVIDICLAQNMTPVREGFADRRYDRVDQLRSRQYEDAVLHEKEDVLRQVGGFLRSELTLADGRQATVHVDSICLHSDTAGAVALSKQIHQYLCDHGIDILAVR